MSVYVDKMKSRYGRMIMSHMIAHTVGELHEMAIKIGVKAKWFQNKKIPHYDICQSKKKLAIENGAIELDRKDFVTVMRLIKK